jgi:orotidine-5'-phosphate decarboxylase
MTTIHLFGGQPMIGTTVDAAKGSSLLILGVSVLTSFNQEQLNGIGVSAEVGDQVQRLVQLGYDVGLRGVVCSPHEIARLRKQFGNDLTIVTPGVRPAGSDKGDQQRVMTPGEAIKEGASYLVIGRPITGAADPAAAARAITNEIAAAL